MSEAKETIKIKIAPELAKQGLGFYDFDQRADIFPNENGKLNPDMIFEVEPTRFVRSKIESGELIVADEEKSKNKDEEAEFTVKVNGTEIKKKMISLRTAKAENTGKVVKVLFDDKEIKEAIKKAGKKMSDISVDVENLIISMVRE